MIRRAAALGAGLIWVGQAAAAPCLAARPTQLVAPYSYDGATVTSLAHPKGSVRVWYAQTGPHALKDAPGRAAVVAGIGDDALTRFSGLGFVSPRSDAALTPCAENGGDGRVDIYLMRMSAGADGAAVREDCVSEASGSSCRGFAVVDKDLASSAYADFEQGAQTVVPHELFHLVQATYDSEIGAWWSEGSAQWATDYLRPELNDLERFLPEYLAATWKPLDAPAGGASNGFLYGTAIFPLFLAERYGPKIIVDTFAHLGGAAESTVDGVARALDVHGSSLAEALPWFAAYVASTGARSGSLGFADAASYPEPTLEPFTGTDPLTAANLTSGLSFRSYLLEGPDAYDIELDADPARNRALVIPLMAGKSQLDVAAAPPLRATAPLLVVVAGVTSNKSDAPFKIRARRVPPEPEPEPEPTPDAAPGPTPAIDAHDTETGSCGVAHSASQFDLWVLALALFSIAIRQTHRRRNHANTS